MRLYDKLYAGIVRGKSLEINVFWLFVIKETIDLSIEKKM